MRYSRVDNCLKILVLLAWSTESISGLRILALYPFNGKSHFVMCEALVKALAEKGHQVDVYGHFPLKKSVPNYKDFSLEGTLPAVINNVSYDMVKHFTSPNLQLMISNITETVCNLMGRPLFQDLFKNLKKNQPYDLVIVEVFLTDCYLAWGKHLDVPIVGVMTSALIDFYNYPLGNPLNTAVDPGLWSPFFSPMGFWDRLMNTVLYNLLFFQYQYYIGIQNQYVEKYFGPGYPDVRDLPKDLDLLLVNSHFSLDGTRPFTPAIVPVGGLHINDDGQKLPNDVQKWLDESKDGCIYFSFGSMVRIETFPKETLNAFYATFKNIAPVRVLFKIAKPEVLPPGLPSNVMTQSWFSQIQVLKHNNIKAFITHGGLMSMTESIYAGVPLIGIPIFGDQPRNIRLQVRRKIAKLVELNEITENTLTSAIKEVINDPDYKTNAELLSKKYFDRPMSPKDTAVYWVEYIARHGKRALRSPIVDMPWWQANLIDVYGFTLLVVITILYVIKFILKRTVRACFSSKKDITKKTE